MDTGTVWKTASFHEPILWRHVSWDRQSPDRDAKEQSPWGWLFYRRIKTDKAFYRPMRRSNAHEITSPFFLQSSRRSVMATLDLRKLFRERC